MKLAPISSTMINNICLGIMVLGLLLFVYESRLLTVHIDDAYISYQYAKNLAAGNGLVFNVGENVEGITNLLWTTIIAGGIYLGWSAETVSHTLGMSSGLALLLASFWYARTVLPGTYSFLAYFAPLLVYASNPFITWVYSGLETCLFAACIIAALAAQKAGRIGICMLFGVLVLLSRPDGVLLVTALIVTQYIEQVRTTRNWWPTREILLHCAVYFLTLTALTAFRIFYYNDFVPNTFYAKVGGVPWTLGFVYIWTFLKDGAIFLVIPFVFAVFRSRQLLNGLVFSLLLLIYVIYVGGEGFLNSRFLLPTIPILAAGALYGIALALEQHRPAIASLTAVCVILMPLWSLLSPKRPVSWEQIREDWTIKRNAAYPRAVEADATTRKIIAKIKELEPPVQLVAALGIGKLRYWSEIPVLDLLGLTDKTIAKNPQDEIGELLVQGHIRSNADYVLSRRPDVILIPRKDSRVMILLPAVKAIWEHPLLEQDYRWNDHLRAYVRNAS